MGLFGKLKETLSKTKESITSKVEVVLKTFKKIDEDTEPKGYYGTLPNIEEDFSYKKQKPSAPKIEIETPTEEELKDENLKSAPVDDALFLDMVIKKEPDSQYLNDVQKIKFALRNIKKCIEENTAATGK